jgi:nitrite reductase/ring-hydroxylating ferredoxin subunit
MPFETVPEGSALAVGKGMTVQVAGQRIALFNLEGNYHAIDDECPHVGAPLGGGWIDGNRVACPMHGWEFDIKTGKGLTVPRCAVKSYPTRVENGEVQIDIG